MSDYKSYKIYAALEQDVNEGWVWLRFKTAGLSEKISRPIIKITNKMTRKSICCEARNIDKNYERKYREGNTCKLKDGPVITMNEWYRKKLGIDKTQDFYCLSICHYPSWSCCRSMRACLDHPQVVVRLATRISILSLALGITSLFVSITVLL